MFNTSICKLISFGNGGHSEEYGNHCRMSGYDQPENWTPRNDCDYSDCIVIDKRPAIETPEGLQWVFKGPLVNVDLPPGTVDRLGDISPIFSQAMADGGNSYGTLLAIHASTIKDQGIGSLDAVDRETFVAGWESLGACIGRVINNQIVWH